MNVKQAARAAKEHIIDIFDDEQITRIALEEVEFDSTTDEWRVTIGFNRPWDANNALTSRLTSDLYRDRSFKVVRIKDGSGEVSAIADRMLAPPA